MEKEKTKFEVMKAKLREIFQYDKNDLDFGIYRILNLKKKEVEEFIEIELEKVVKEKLSELESAEGEFDKEKLEELQKTIEETFGEKMAVLKREKNPKGKLKEYIELEEDIKSKENLEELREDIYDRILTFFGRYYEGGDFISKGIYSDSNKYSIPYNGDEVYLHWANKDQYYTKTTESFRDYKFKLKELEIHFKIKEEEVKEEQNNNKSDKKYFIYINSEYEKSDKKLILYFGYRDLKETESKEIVEFNGGKAINNDSVFSYNLNKIRIELGVDKSSLNELDILNSKHKDLVKGTTHETKTELEWNFQKYVAKNNTDYFIHKDLKGFLRRELDFYIKNEMFNIDRIGNSDEIEFNLKKIKTFKEISEKIIDFLSQIEEFQKRMWEKKKFVVDTEYCMTLDYIDKKHYGAILKNKKQIEEWGKLKFINEKTKLNEKYLEENQTLVVDTIFFPELRWSFLGEIDDLEEKTNGILINSENFQALNLLLNKYKEKIKCCYIDPPYNTGSDGFLYKDGYSHSSWMSLMNDRLILARELLNDEGILFSSIDDNEIKNLNKIQDNLFGNENFIANLVWENKEGGGSSDSKFFRIKHEYVTNYSKDINSLNLKGDVKEEDESYNYEDKFVKERGKYKLIKLNSFSIQSSPSLEYEIKLPNGEIIKPHENGKKGCWRWGEKQFKWGVENEFIEFKENTSGKLWVYTKQYFKVDHKGNKIIREVPYRGVISKFSSTQATKQLEKLFGDKPFAYSKPVDYIRFLLDLNVDTNNQDCIIDFFAGSGTTGHAVLNLNKDNEGNRKFILVEMGEYFDSVTKPRIQKVIYSQNWKDGKPVDNDGSKKQIIKYHSLEQYEDSLNNIEFENQPQLVLDTKNYKIKYMLDFESKNNNVFMNIENLENPFDYKMNINGVEKKIDLVETFNYLANIKVSNISKLKNNYVVVKGEREGKKVLVVWRNFKDIDKKKDKEFIEKELKSEDFDEVYVNSDSLVKNAKPLDIIMKEEIFGGI